MAQVQDRVRCPRPIGAATLKEAYFNWLGGLGRLTASGPQIGRGAAILLRFGPPTALEQGWRWPITGGLLTRRPGGEMRLQWEEGELLLTVSGYSPRLPSRLYSLFQIPAHHLVSRLFLLQLRGPMPAPGMPGPPLPRLAAAGLDLALVALAGRRWRRHPWSGVLALAAAYHLIAWSWGGRTVGARCLGLKVVARDGSPLSAGQALVRLLAAPLSLPLRGALHDRLAQSEVVRPHAD